MGFFDFFKDTSDSMGAYFWPTIISTGAQLASQLTSGDDFHPYGQTEEGFNAQLALDREQLAQQMAIAKESAGAHVAAAKAAAGATVAAANIARESAMRQAVMKQVGDNLAYKLDAKKSGFQALQKAQENILAAKYKQAELMSALYQQAGASLMGMAK